MIECIPVVVPANVSSHFYLLRGKSYRVRAIEVDWTDAGGAVQKLLSVFIVDQGGNALWRSSTPLIIAAQTLFAQFGIGMSHGSGTDAVSGQTWAQSSIPDVWIDQDSQITVQVFTPEAATFLQRFVLFLERHDEPR